MEKTEPLTREVGTVTASGVWISLTHTQYITGQALPQNLVPWRLNAKGWMEFNAGDVLIYLRVRELRWRRYGPAGPNRTKEMLRAINKRFYERQRVARELERAAKRAAGQDANDS